jgi:hypothetical protein
LLGIKKKTLKFTTLKFYNRQIAWDQEKNPKIYNPKVLQQTNYCLGSRKKTLNSTTLKLYNRQIIAWEQEKKP